MKEVRDVATLMKASLQQLKEAAKHTLDEFRSEMIISHANMSKVAAMTKELKAANKEVEEVLGGAASNFPTISDDTPQQPAAARPGYQAGTQRTASVADGNGNLIHK